MKYKKHDITHICGYRECIYDAISTSLYNVFCRKSGQQASLYPSQPYPLTDKQKEEDQQLTIQEEQAKAQVWMNTLVNAYK